MRHRFNPPLVSVVLCLLLAAACSHSSDDKQNASFAKMGLSLQQVIEPVSVAANPATIVIDTTNAGTPTDPNTGKFIGTSAIQATLRDTAGAPRPGVEVVFSTDAGTLASAGAPVMTNDQGVVNDTLTVPQDALSPVHVTATAGEESGTVAIPIQVVLPNDPPVANAGPDQTVECSSPSGTPVTVNGGASTDPNSTPGTNDDITKYEWLVGGAVVASTATATITVPTGATVVTLRVTDKQGATATDDVVITVADTTPATLRLNADPRILWPPNHTLRTVHVGAEVTDTCSAPGTAIVSLVSVTSNEPDNGTGDGDTDGDIAGAALGTDDRSIQLRAERSGHGRGRVYTLVYSVTDAAGVATEASAVVRVPHNQGF